MRYLGNLGGLKRRLPIHPGAYLLPITVLEVRLDSIQVRRDHAEPFLGRRPFFNRTKI